MKHGPVETQFTIYEDFYSYKSGIYVHTTGAEVGGHAAKIFGWGKQNYTNYWIVANNWGTSWGMDGYFWIEFEKCGIDTAAFVSAAGKIVKPKN